MFFFSIFLTTTTFLASKVVVIFATMMLSMFMRAHAPETRQCRRCFLLFLALLHTLVTIPAVNKWTSVYEALCTVTLVCSMRNIVIDAQLRTQDMCRDLDAPDVEGDGEAPCCATEHVEESFTLVSRHSRVCHAYVT